MRRQKAAISWSPGSSYRRRAAAVGLDRRDVERRHEGVQPLAQLLPSNGHSRHVRSNVQLASAFFVYSSYIHLSSEDLHARIPRCIGFVRFVVVLLRRWHASIITHRHSPAPCECNITAPGTSLIGVPLSRYTRFCRRPRKPIANLRTAHCSFTAAAKSAGDECTIHSNVLSSHSRRSHPRHFRDCVRERPATARLISLNLSSVSTADDRRRAYLDRQANPGQRRRESSRSTAMASGGQPTVIVPLRC